MIGFTGSPLDRADHLRADPERVAALARAPGSLMAKLTLLDPVLDEDGRLAWVEPEGEPLAFLGFINGIARFALLSGERGAARRTSGLSALLDRMPPDEAATYALARSLVDWHARHGFCATCGGKTHPIRAGWARACAACGAEHFPRTDSVVIMLAEHGGDVLLGRQPAFPPGRYSALAGFLEPGEAIEEAVARELKEEAGVVATHVRYVASQPWPFPSSLMIGCIATVADRHITVDRTELEDARWFSRAALAAAMAGAPDAAFGVPPPYAIAHSLMAAWLAGQ
ncbi:NAD+ diphosphatase [Sphingomonas jejuensis]|uniref:NAD(+) diphosphatase n=1 Tax=Sphingomonas jejuensis TaxID=904715 RepID=A0ABX0XP18_9SPHN|nr:NAD(+) diphosphatase [Sphingomonas jejuensis]NJC35142.1 NAD+ diphosphatase [Sphingomonas jejuensis]